MDGYYSAEQALTFDPELADGTFRVVDRAGTMFLLPGIDGYRLMEIMRAAGLPIASTCGGACACGTCHVYIDENWLDRLASPKPEEEAKIDTLLHARPNSRLACQVIWHQGAMDGLSLSLAPLEE
jgi:2Fe-2S ferredoxin